MILLIFSSIIQYSIAFVTFQSGPLEDYYVFASSNILYASSTPGRSYLKVFYFNSAFQNPPQIFITSICYDLDAGSQGFEFSIFGITTTSFTAQVTATQASVFNGFCFYYQAFDNKRRQVLSFFNQKNPTTQILKYSHSNPNFSVGIISHQVLNTRFILVSFTGILNEKIKVTEGTQSDFSISIEVNGLTQIVFQVLLGTSDAFYHQQYGNSFIKTCYSCTIPAFYFQIGWEDAELYSMYTGIQYTNAQTFRTRLNRYDYSDNTQNEYRVETWAGSWLNWAKHRFGAIRRNWDPGFYKSFKCFDFFQSRYQDDAITDNLRIEIQELQIDLSAIGQTVHQINGNNLQLTVNLTCIIQQGQIFTTTLLPINNCSDKYFTQQNQYKLNTNLIKQTALFKVDKGQISFLRITIDSKSIKLEHQYIDYQQNTEMIASFVIN